MDVKANVVKEIVPTLLNLSNRMERNEYVKYAAKELHVAEAGLWQELRDAGFKETTTAGQIRQAKRVNRKLTPRAQIERQLIEALIQSPTLIPYVKSRFHYDSFTEPHFVKIAQLLWEANVDDEDVDIQTLINECPDDKLRAFISSAILRKVPPNLQARVDGCLKKLRHFLLQDHERLVRSHARAEGADEMEILEESVKLSNQRRALRDRDTLDTRGEN